MLLKNLQMAKHMCEVLKKKKPSFFLYLSSDAVYSDTKKKLMKILQQFQIHYMG